MKTKELVFLCGALLICACHCYGGQDNAGKYTCASDSDCTNSCSEGAVNGQWYLNKFDHKQECRDGCNGPGTRPARCINNTCMAFSFGQYDGSCTKGPKPADPLLPEITKYSCAFNFDCTLSCSQGAVNKMWYQHSGQFKQDCLDGCAADGFDSKCENHICEAYFEGKRYPGCTKKGD